MARPKKSSNYKVIQDIDLSKNNMYNVNAIVGNSYDFEPNDLIITTYDTDADPTNLPSNAGNLILRAGVADKDLAYSGSVHIFAGNEVEPNEDSTVLDTLASSVYSPLNGKSSRVKNGITVDPDEGVFIKSEILVDSEADTKTGTVSIDANNTLNIESKDKTTFNSPNVTKTVTTEADEVGTLTETFTTQHTETANKLNIYAGSSNPSDATLTVESNHKENGVHTEHSYINVDKIVVDKTVNEGIKTDRVDRNVFATTDTTDVSKYLKIKAPGFDLNAGSADGNTETALLKVTEIISTDNDLKNLTLGGDKHGHQGAFVVDNTSVDIDTNTLNINVPNNLHEDTPTVGTVFELSVDDESSLMHIDDVNIDKTLLVGKEDTKSESAKIYTKNFVLDTNTKNAKDTGLSITGNYGLKITDHYPKENPTESFINVNHINVGTVDVVTDKANDVIVSKSIKTTGATVDVKLTSDSNDVLVNEENANKIRDVEINSTTINIKGGSKNNLHITSSLTDGEVGRLDTKGLVAGDSFIETDDLRINKNFYANQFYIYWDDRINSLVFANSEQTPKG